MVERRLSKVAARAWSDPGYRQALRERPGRVLAEAGVALAAHADVRVIEVEPGAAPELVTLGGGFEVRLPAPPPGAAGGRAVASSLPARPRIPSHVRLWVDTPGEDEEVLLVSTERRKLRLGGVGGRAVLEQVVPLLDGSRTLAGVREAASGTFAPDELDRALGTLARQGLLEAADQDDPRYAPQRNFFRELDAEPAQAQRRLAQSTVAIVGMGGAGTAAALALAAAGVGTIRCVDPAVVVVTDASLAPVLGASRSGQSRAATAAAAVAAVGSGVRAVANDEGLASDEEVLAAIADADFVIACADALAPATLYRVNRACLQAEIPWTPCAVSGFEGLLGPTVQPGESACYVCAQLRGAACDPSPEDALSREAFLDERRRDDSPTRESLAAAAGAIGNLAALEAIHTLAAAIVPPAKEQLVAIDLLTLTSSRHRVLRVPTCPACGPAATPAREPEPPSDGLLELVSSRVGIVKRLEPLERDEREPEPPVIVIAELADFDLAGDTRSRPTVGVGKGESVEEATPGAIGEAVERYCACHIDHRALVRASAAELGEQAITPEDLILYSEEQYARGDTAYRPFDPQRPIHWMRGRALGADGEVLVPASLAAMDYRGELAGEAWCYNTSNGLAAGPTPEAATLGGLLELVERDAFLIAWMHRLAVPELELRGVGGLSGRLRGHYARVGVDVRVFDLTSDIGPCVLMGVAIDRTSHGPSAVVGLGCDLDPGAALRKALLEVCQGRAGETWRMRHRAAGVRAYEDVRKIEDHSALFAEPERLGELAFLLETPRRRRVDELPDLATGDVAADLAATVARLERVGSRVASVDLTTPDVRALGIHVVRAVATGLQPIHFGFRQERLGGRRLFEAPRAMGHGVHVRTARDLNPCPHPLP